MHLESGEKLQAGMSGDIDKMIIAAHELEGKIYPDGCVN